MLMNIHLTTSLKQITIDRVVRELAQKQKEKKMKLRDGTEVNASPQICGALDVLIGECVKAHGYGVLKSYDAWPDRVLERGVVKALIYWRANGYAAWVAYINENGDVVRIAYPLEAEGIRR